MSSHNVEANLRPDPDPELVAIADYVCDYRIDSREALDTARNCLMDSLGCALLALHYPECTKHLGPLVQGTLVPNGAKVPGTSFQLDPVKAAWDIGALVRWLDFNDTWLAADPRIDALREKMTVREDPRYSSEYLDPDKRSIANAVQVFFKGGTHTSKVEVEYPIGHRRRRAEGIPVLEQKFLGALRTRFPRGQAQRIYDLCRDAERLAATPVNVFLDLFVI